MLQEANPPFSRSSAISPTRRWEKMCGYDVKNDLLGAVFQYKRPKALHSKRDDLVRFDLNMHQWLVLLLLFDSGQAFFALPAVMEYEELPDTLSNTIFVDVHGIRWNTSMVYLPPDPCPTSTYADCDDSGNKASITGKINNGEKYLIDPKYVYCWDDLNVDLCDHEIGILLRRDGNQTADACSFEDRIESIGRFAMTETDVVDVLFRDKSRQYESTDEILQEVNDINNLIKYVEQEDPIARILQLLSRQHDIYEDHYDSGDRREEIASILFALQEFRREELATADDPTTHLVGDAEIGMFT
ncbi:hypothetical protein OB920_18705 [Halobacteria archaeon HArc-gm2]|nr:hypothetical protein [Halobacteria archaeon HArc-gm2]